MMDHNRSSSSICWSLFGWSSFVFFRVQGVFLDFKLSFRWYLVWLSAGVPWWRWAWSLVVCCNSIFLFLFARLIKIWQISCRLSKKLAGKYLPTRQGRAGENWGPVPNYKMMPYLLIDRIIVIIINSTYISCNVLISWNTINNHIYEG